MPEHRKQAAPGRRSGPGKAPTGRVTAKGPPPSARYTPPIPKEQKVSSRWVPILMFAFLGVGMLMIVANYLDVLPGDGPSNWYLLGGLGLITAGFIVATRWR